MIPEPCARPVFALQVAEVILFWGPSSVFFLYPFSRECTILPQLSIVLFNQFERLILRLSIGQVKVGAIGVFIRDDFVGISQVSGVFRRVPEVKVAVAVFADDAIVFELLNFSGPFTAVGGNLQAGLFVLGLGRSRFLVDIEADIDADFDRLRRGEIDGGSTAIEEKRGEKEAREWQKTCPGKGRGRVKIHEEAMSLAKSRWAANCYRLSESLATFELV